MTDEKNVGVQPETCDTSENGAVETTTSTPSDGEFTVPVKFNKVIKNLTVPQAAELAQKGMKFDMIRADHERLCALAAAEGKSVSGFIDALENSKKLSRRDEILEICGGNEEFAEHIISLEQNAKCDDNGLDELREFFPEFDSEEKLPEQVTQAARLKGTRLLDEYLRYRLQEKRNRMTAEKSRKMAEFSTTGSQRRYGTDSDPVNIEFLRGIWQK